MQQDQIDLLRQRPVCDPHLIIGSRRISSAQRQSIDVVSPIDGQVIALLPDAVPQDVEEAVSEARNSFERGSWAGMAPKERKKKMLAWADLIEKKFL